MSVEKDIVVVKYGSPSVTSEIGMDHERLASYSSEIARLMVRHHVVIVSSGSIVTGRALHEGQHPIRDSSAAAMGSAQAFLAWQEALELQGMDAGQVPVTNHEIDSEEGTTLKESLFNMMNEAIVPIANGNDVLSREGSKELRIDTDNDRLAGHIAELVEAEHLILLTDREGVLDPQKVVVKNVDTSNLDQVLGFVDEGGNGERGGMASKIIVAYRASHFGSQAAHAHIANARADLKAVLDNQDGSHFVPYQ
jgi:glutamate 5-kinase